MKTALVSLGPVSDLIACFDDHVCINNRAANHGSAFDDGAGKKNGMSHINTGFQDNTGG